MHRGGEVGPFTIEVRGESAAGDVLVARRATVSFVAGEVRVLRMHLLASCVGVSCSEDETCGEGGCRSRRIAEDELEPWEGAPSGLDRDAGERGRDAGRRHDAGTECRSDAECDDGVPCTIDVCVGGACLSAPDASLCAPDAHACTIEVCDASLGCVPRLEHALCDDAVGCTVDRCDVTLGCVREPADAACDDGVACTVDRCDALLGCASVPDDAACDDGVACTVDHCDGALGCASVPDDAACDDGIGCTIDACDPIAGCASSITSASCPYGERCDRTAAACVPAPTFTEVYAFLSRDCVGWCHDAGADGGLDLSSPALAYASLVGVTAACGGGANTRVIPYEAAASLLWRKLARVDLCGSRMPPAGIPSSDSDVRRVERWIAAGAPDN
ncbi:MAG: hypothetical protein M5U28_38455 [Sandaracinaceae bacterium]|nr:hypothetical protein [Sandaracinaceae bacterium]